MKIFKELNKLGYKHYTEHTVEELDDLPLDSEERIMEQALVLRWFREKYDVYHFVTREVGINTSDIFFVASYYKGKKGNSPKDTCVSSRTYEEAELACLKKLIQIIKDGKVQTN